VKWAIQILEIAAVHIIRALGFQEIIPIRNIK
jgi:hypothetical protein